MLDETDDEEYVFKLSCLYHWWEQEEPLSNYTDSSYTESQWFNE